MIRLKVQLLY